MAFCLPNKLTKLLLVGEVHLLIEPDAGNIPGLIEIIIVANHSLLPAF
jgi:hypothetical protein